MVLRLVEAEECLAGFYVPEEYDAELERWRVERRRTRISLLIGLVCLLVLGVGVGWVYSLGSIDLLYVAVAAVLVALGFVRWVISVYLEVL